MDKTDFKKTVPSYRATAGRFEIIEVPPLQYLMIDGHGDPNAGGPFAEAVTALFSVGYKLKFTSKNDLGRDYAVMPLEGLWTSDDPANFTTALDKSTWDWTMLMMVPDWIDARMFTAARDAARTKGGPGVDRLRLETLNEGRCVQILHLGSFDSEAATLHRLHTEFVPDNGLQLRGVHHEIYLSDFTRTAPEKLRTILRQPVA
ncbi:MAG: GyrI-like domain-containing protein [Propionibacteriales bacterium]|nr:GyrI-like domain-containing protein [Propionibacteriales bacterium]